jgi:hypothetical protein
LGKEDSLKWSNVSAILSNLYDKIQKAIYHTLLICTILIIGILGFRVSFKAVESQSKSWIEKIASLGTIPEVDVCVNVANQLKIEEMKKAKIPSKSIPDQILIIQKIKCARLIEILKYIQGRMTLHSELMGYLYTRMYAALITALASGLIATVVLVFVTREGWKDANSYLLATFLSFAILGSFYGMFPGIFEQKKNAEANKNLCIAYDTVAHDINNYLVTGLDQTGKNVSLENFILSVGKRLTTLRSLPFDMNPEEVVALTQKVQEVVDQQARSDEESN